MNTPVWATPKGFVHVPFSCGEPVSTLISGKGVVLSQMATNPFEPALGTWFTETVTEAVAVVHGATPGTV